MRASWFSFGKILQALLLALLLMIPGFVSQAEAADYNPEDFEPGAAEIEVGDHAYLEVQSDPDLAQVVVIRLD